MLSLSPGWRGQPYIAEETVKDLGAVQYLAAHASPGDPIVVMGYRRSVTAYYLDRARRPYTLRSFPAELASTPAGSAPRACSATASGSPRKARRWPASS